MITWTSDARPGRPYWWEAAEPTETDDTAAPETDVAIIGAGYTGLSAAIVAADAGARVQVLEAGIAGQGASTRNGGMFGAHPRLSWDALSSAFGAETADALFGEAQPAMDWVRALIEREEIACDFQQTGRIQLAWTKAHLANQTKLAATVRAKSNVRIETISRADLGQEISTDRYFGGLIFPDHGALHPAKFHAGLVRAAQKRGVTIVQMCPVDGVERDGARFRLRAGGREIRADKVILATNGYTPPSFRWHQKRVFALPSYLIATEPLSQNLLGQLAPGRRMMVETRARHSYYRLSPDSTRLLFGGRAFMRPVAPEIAAKRLFETMCDIWPDLEGTRLSHAWTGNTGYSFSHMPQVGEVGGMHYALGFSGSGTVMAPYLGAKVAYRALGDARGKTAYADTPLKTHWLHPFRRPYFLTAADLWYHHWVDRWEMRDGRRA